MRRYLAGRCGDMVWNALILITLLLPLASLSIDIPRYFVLKSRLQLAADGAAEAAAQRVDVAHFRDTGEVRLASDAYAQAHWAAAALLPMHERGYATTIERFAVDEQADTVTVGLVGTTHLFFGLSPAIRVRAEALSRFRMAQR